MTNNAIHPFHLHGHKFRVLGMDVLGTNVTLDEVKRLDGEGKLERNFHHPPSKDSVIVPNRGYTIIRFNADNPGYWLFHCHLQFHSENGMGLVFKVGEEHDFPPIPELFPTCGNYLPHESGNEIDFREGKSLENASSFASDEDYDTQVRPLPHGGWFKIPNLAQKNVQPTLPVIIFIAACLLSV